MKELKRIFIIVTSCYIVLVFYSCNNSNTSNPVNNTPTTINVNGKVLDAYGNAMGSVTVVIGNQNTITGGDGSFTINNVTKPYDVYVLSSTNGVLGVKGLNITNPFIPGGIIGSPSPELTVNIPVVPNGSRATVIFDDTITGKISGYAQIPGNNSMGIINLGGINGQQVAGKVYVLEYTFSNGVVGAYSLYGEQTTSFAIGSNATVSFTSLNNLSGGSTITGSVIGSGGSNITAQLFINFGSKNNITHRGGLVQTITGTTFTFNVPTGTLTTPILNVHASSANPNVQRMMTISAGSSGTITLDSVSILQTPPNNATSVDTSTQFTYSSGSGNGLNFIRLTPVGSGGRFFQIITRGTSLNIPNFSNLGYTLGSSIQYSWQDNRLLNVNSADDFCTQYFDLNPSIVATNQSSAFMFTSK